MIEIGIPILLKLGPGAIAIFVVVIMLLVVASFALGAKTGRRAENRKIALYILNRIGYDSIEQWEEELKRKNEGR